jgi:glycosyltransferase involved in cell wall biosynthesis
MKILHFITGLNVGGAESSLFRLLKQDLRNEHLVISLSGRGHFSDKLDALGIKTLNINLRKLRNLFKNLRIIIQFSKDNKPDLVQTWMYHSDLLGGLIGCFFLKVKVIWNVRHFNTSFSENKFLTWLLIRFNAIMSYVLPTKIICCSQNSIFVHRRLCYANKFIYIPNGIDFSEYPEFSSVINFEKPFNIGYFARWDIIKGHKYLLEALSKIDFNSMRINKCFLVGKGINSKNQELMSLIEKYNLRHKIKLHGFQEDLISYYQSIEIFIQPSLGEGFPNVILESMANGNVCIGTNVGETSYLINNQDFVFEPRKSELILDCLESVLNLRRVNPDAYNEIKKNNYNIARKNFSIEKMLDRYHSIWKQICVA